MRFEWDENKKRINLQRHKIDFADVGQIFDYERYTIIDDRFDYGEPRFFTLGLINGRVVAVSHTETDNLIRIISARKADKNEQAKYYKKIRN
ncbi:MAG: BrnT family toxin [Acidobacteriota bacterium]|nr:BrnT family toxin [Acidobacteriota bacterium]